MTMPTTDMQAELAARSIELAIEAVTDAVLRLAEAPQKSPLLSRWYFKLRASLALFLWARDRLHKEGATPLHGAEEVLRLPLLLLRARAVELRRALGDTAPANGEWRQLRAAIAYFEGALGHRNLRPSAAPVIPDIPTVIAIAGAQG